MRGPVLSTLRRKGTIMQWRQGRSSAELVTQLMNKLPFLEISQMPAGILWNIGVIKNITPIKIDLSRSHMENELNFKNIQKSDNDATLINLKARKTKQQVKLKKI